MVGPYSPDATAIRGAASPLARLFGPVAGDRRFYHGLDVLRGLAAVAVVFCHYRSFFIPTPDTLATVAQLEAEPLYWLLRPIYLYGKWAVEFFWLLSGFVFASVYAGTQPLPQRFFWARFARLYPLHLVTLLVVAGLQVYSIATTGAPKIDGHDDLVHFAAHLLFVSAWEPGFIPSFNGPVWSVSVEILAYILFFLTLPKLFRFGIAVPAAIALLFRFAQLFSNSPIWMCGYLFFAGCAIYALHRAVPRRWQIMAGLLAFASAAGLLAVVHGHAIFLGISILLASLLLVVAALEPVIGGFAARADWLGAASYSIYLWHTPIQIGLLLAVAEPSRTMASPLALVAFIGMVLLVAWMSFRYFERPWRDRINRWAATRYPAPARLREPPVASAPR